MDESPHLRVCNGYRDMCPRVLCTDKDRVAKCRLCPSRFCQNCVNQLIDDLCHACFKPCRHCQRKDCGVTVQCKTCDMYYCAECTHPDLRLISVDCMRTATAITKTHNDCGVSEPFVFDASSCNAARFYITACVNCPNEERRRCGNCLTANECAASTGNCICGVGALCRYCLFDHDCLRRRVELQITHGLQSTDNNKFKDMAIAFVRKKENWGAFVTMASKV